MSFAIRSISKKGLKKNKKIKFSKKHKDATKNPYGVIAPDSDDNSEGQNLHENNHSDNRADQILEENLTAQQNNLNQIEEDPIGGGLISIEEGMTRRQLALVLSTLPKEDQDAINTLIRKENILQSLEIEYSVEDYIHDYSGANDNSQRNDGGDRLTEYKADARVAGFGEQLWFALTGTIICAGAITQAAATDNGLFQAAAVCVCLDRMKTLLDVISEDTRRELYGDPVRMRKLADLKMGGYYTNDTPLLGDLKKAQEWIEEQNEEFGIKEVDQDDLISRHIPDKGVIGNQGNPKPWEDDGAINWGELGKSNPNQDDSTKAHTGDALVTDPPKDSGDGEGDVEPPEPPTGNGLRNISSNMSSSNSEMKGNTGLFMDFYQKAWAVDQNGDIDDITKHGKQVGDDSYRGWDMVAAEVINGVNTAIWIHETGKMSCWQLDSKWDYQSHQIHLGGTKGFKDEETQFGTDFDKDGLIGLVAEKM